MILIIIIEILISWISKYTIYDLQKYRKVSIADSKEHIVKKLICTNGFKTLFFEGIDDSFFITCCQLKL